MAKISIITVVYNDFKNFKKTLASVQTQTFTDIEYIVVDGGSKDGTVDFIKQHNTISKWISEPDKGLYDAMNKGIDLATGDYLLFLNAGDLFYNNKVLEDIFTHPCKNGDIYYGDTIFIDDNNRFLGFRNHIPPKNLTFKSYLMGMVVCHQSIIIRRDIVQKFNISYRFVADYDSVARSLQQAKTVVNCQMIICRYLDGGLSAKNKRQSNIERFKAMQKIYGTLPTIVSHVLIISRLIFVRLKGRGILRNYDKSLHL